MAAIERDDLDKEFTYDGHQFRENKDSVRALRKRVDQLIFQKK